MMIPADSILIECFENANNKSDLDMSNQASEISSESTMTVNELEVTGLRAYVLKRTITKE